MGDDHNACLKLSRITLIVGLAGGAIMLLLGIISLKDSFVTAAISIVLASISFLLIIAYCNIQLSYGNERFIYRNFAGKTREYDYTSIAGIRYGADYILYLSDGRRIRLELFLVGRENFIRDIEQSRRAGGALTAKLPEMKSKLFNDNVYSPEELVAIWIMLFIFPCALALIALSDAELRSTDIYAAMAILVGSFWGLNLIVGLLYHHILRNMERYPKIIKYFIKPSHIKNEHVKKQLGTAPKKKKK